ncbi:hypothetical protein [Brachyspira hyodysenteriae]|uniref:hypothetical protein n=1 Tax=Brachyspira hyodysenteriae TaxID=159 RepID=UPI00063D9E69|nr:hypothetical protein [Brachyspira hyodysenteriae]KLI26620.1 hypothetical protein SU43_00650 [Brachyspira hyodysenteriae]TVL61003.1 hypothetical protein A9X86_09390 [Brachyspira hyodysenteriae]TVL81899.1 hypothetical protein A9X82_12815 [Brachyspira hyodysenteriae]
MKHNLKSDLDKLENRGMALEDDINTMKNKPLEELIYCLNDDNAVIRTSASINLKYYIDDDNVQDELLVQLSKEKSLYTKIAICETLQSGNINTAEKMTEYLGIIGNNQYKKLPKKISSKKSYPLPRDIIARTLSKMDISILPALIKILKSSNLIKIYEALDAFGYMCFYNKDLQNKKNLEYIIKLMNKYKDDKFLIWKCLTCLSAFNLEKSREILNTFINKDNEDILSLEAQRSLSILNKKTK